MRSMLLALAFGLVSTALYAARPVTEGPLPAADDYTVLTGKVIIGTIDAHTIGVVVDGEPYRHLFRLWTSASLKPFRATSQSASIEYRGDELVIMAADQQWFYALALSTGDLRVPRQPVGFTAARYIGYGLNHEIRPFTAQPATQASDRHAVNPLDCDDFGNCFFYPDYDQGGNGGSCDSGGVGSNSCSVSNSSGSCSVNCSTGYACCTNATYTSSAYCRCKT